MIQINLGPVGWEVRFVPPFSFPISFFETPLMVRLPDSCSLIKDPEERTDNYTTPQLWLAVGKTWGQDDAWLSATRANPDLARSCQANPFFSVLGGNGMDWSSSILAVRALSDRSVVQYVYRSLAERERLDCPPYDLFLFPQTLLHHLKTPIAH